MVSTDDDDDDDNKLSNLFLWIMMSNYIFI